MIKVANSFSYNQNFVPQGYLPFLLGYMYKNLIIFKCLLWKARLVFTRLHIRPSVEGVLSICLNDSVSLNKLATMPIYCKKHYFFLQNQGLKV